MGFLGTYLHRIWRIYCICLFTCAYSRAIHLEVAEDLSAETFLHVFRRFAARRSCPRKMISDNATNFVSGAGFIKDIMNQPKLQRALKARQCHWQFSPARSPWFNGFIERMIGVVKICLKKTLHRRKLTKQELITILTEIENRVNNRPLTYISDDLDQEPLTPSHLLHGRRIEGFPCAGLEEDPEDPDYEIDGNYLRRGYQRLSKVLREWEGYWERDYLSSLRERHYGNQSANNTSQVREGDVVLVRSDKPRASWPLGRILKLHPDSNNIIRMVTVRSEGRDSLRTLEKLIPMELASPLELEEDTEVEAEETNEPARPIRRAAVTARNRWLNLRDTGGIT